MVITAWPMIIIQPHQEKGQNFAQELNFPCVFNALYTIVVWRKKTAAGACFRGCIYIYIYVYIISQAFVKFVGEKKRSSSYFVHGKCLKRRERVKKEDIYYASQRYIHIRKYTYIVTGCMTRLYPIIISFKVFRIFGYTRLKERHC